MSLTVASARPAGLFADQIIDVPAGGSLQAALNQAQPGATIRLEPGATYAGNYTLPAKNGLSFIVITTRDAALPPPGVRIDPSYKPRLATIKSPSTSAPLITAAGASYYRIVGVAFEANKNGAGDIIMLGNSTQTTIAQVPHHIELDRVLIAGDPTVGQKRAISANAANVVIENSDIRGIAAVGQDSQAIGAWNTWGPITIRNNFLEAAGENIMFGGAHITLPNAVPSDIVVEDNLLTKDLKWRGTPFTVKNLFELKNARRVTVRRNAMQFNWGGAQAGFAVVFTPRNSSGQTPWVTVEDVEFSGNIVAHSGSGFNILGRDDTALSNQLARIVVRDNLVFDIANDAWDGAGIFAQLGGEPRDVAFDHNTIIHDGSAIVFYSGAYMGPNGVGLPGGPIYGFVFTNNLLKHNEYGIFGSGQAPGNPAILHYAPGAVVQRNVMASDKSVASRFPGDNLFPTVADFNATFQDLAAGDYRLATNSPYINAGTDGRNIGSEFTALFASLPRAPKKVRIVKVIW